MKNKLLLLFVLFVSFYSVSLKAQQEIFINEVMASNDTTIADNTAEYEDWIELYNSTADPLLLDGYYISNDISNPLKFRFTGNLQVPANGYLILWASNDITRGATHLPLKVSASGESLYLYLPDGTTLVDSISVGKQKTDISYGRRTDGAAERSFFAKPTPGATNNTSTGYLGIVSSPIFSVNAGFYPAPFSLTISSVDPDVQLIYTTNGSLPDTDNFNGTVYRYKNKYQANPGDLPGSFLYDSFRSVLYTNPLAITNASVNPNRLSLKSSTYDAAPGYFPTTLINKATVVRAVAIKEGYISSESTSASYFITPGGINKYSLPVISFATSEDNLFSYDKGIYNAGVDFDLWRALNPAVVASGNTPANWNRRDWDEDLEFPASFELFTPNKTTRELQTNVGWTVNGNWSRARHQKSFRIYFRGSYGSENINYPILPDLPYKNYERLVLNSAGQDLSSTHMRDMVIQACVKHLKLETLHSTPSVAFVNGELWGFLNVRERYDDNYFNQVYDIQKEELDLLENRSTIKEGTDTEILSLRNFFAANDMSIPQNYEAVQTRMDMDNFIDYQITEIYFGNNDWPTNNQSYFRKRVPFTPDAPYGHDGRFRWLAIDFDRGLGAASSYGVTYNNLAWATGTRTDVNPSTWATDMIRKLLNNVNFRNQFITRYADLNNTTFLPANIVSRINYYKDLMAPHIAEHVQRWKRPFSVNAWLDSVNNLIKYANQRPFYVKQHLREYFSLSSEQELTVDVSDSAHGFIRVNTIDITPAFPGVPQNTYPWKGLYYPEIPVTLVAKPKDGYRFVRWEGDSTSTEDSIVVNLSAAKSFKAIFESTDVPVSTVFNYWHFNNLPTGTLTSVVADSTVPGNAVITYEGTGAGYIDRVDPGSIVNVKFEQPAGFGLRPRNPSNTRSLFISTPTTNYKDIVLTYAATRTSSGAEYQRVFYTTDGTVWQLKTDSILVSTPETTFGLQTIDFSTDANTADNPAFAVRIEFFGNNAAGTSGNNRIDNIAVSGIPLSVNELPTVTISSDKTTVCTTSTVTFTATITNAGESVSFQWKRNGVNAGTNSNSYTDSNFANGDTFYCVLTDGTTSVTSNKIIIVVVPSPVVITLSKTPASACAADGEITINGIGGALPYEYSLDGADYVPSNVFMGLAEGSYTAYIRDAKGCAATFTDGLTKVSPIVITSLNITSVSACGNNSDGRISISRTGGTHPQLYSLNNVDYFTSNIFTDLPAGTYTAYVKDARGCMATFSGVITKASPLRITSVVRTQPSPCSANGKLTINKTGGSSPFLYSINGVNYVSTNVFSNLAGGTYTAYVKDKRGCIASLSGLILTAPPCSIVARPPVKEQTITLVKLRIKAFPNPSAEQFSVIAESSNNSGVEFIVTDLAGRRLLYTRTAPNTVFSIGKQLSSGMYFIEALQGKERATLKILKVK